MSIAYQQPYKMVKVRDLKTTKEYQRLLSAKKIAKIKTKMLKYGYFADEPILVTPDMAIINGQHRCEAAKKAGIEKVPVTVVYTKAPGIVESTNGGIPETELFEKRNEDITTLPPSDWWWNKYCAGDRLAKLIYKFDDSGSRWEGEVAIKKSPNHVPRKQGKISPQEIACFYYCIGSRSARPAWYHSSHHERFLKHISNWEDKDLVNRLCILANNFVKIWGTKRENPLAYKHKVISFLIVFLNGLAEEDFLCKQDEIDAIHEKMKVFDLRGGFYHDSGEFKLKALQAHFNTKKRKHKLNVF